MRMQRIQIESCLNLFLLQPVDQLSEILETAFDPRRRDDRPGIGRKLPTHEGLVIGLNLTVIAFQNIASCALDVIAHGRPAADRRNQATEAIQISTSYLEAIKRHWSVLDNWVDGSLPPTPVDPRAERYSFLVELTCLTVHGVHLATCPPIPELRQVVILAETGTDQVERLVTQIGRPFEPRGSR